MFNMILQISTKFQRYFIGIKTKNDPKIESLLLKRSYEKIKDHLCKPILEVYGVHHYYERAGTSCSNTRVTDISLPFRLIRILILSPYFMAVTDFTQGLACRNVLAIYADDDVFDFNTRFLCRASGFYR